MIIKSFKNFVFLLVVLVFKANIFCMNFFLQAPEELKKCELKTQELKTEEETKTISMCFSGKSGRCTFGYGQASGVYVKYQVKDLPDSLDKKIKSLFKKLDSKKVRDGLEYELLYGVLPECYDRGEDISMESYYAGEKLETKESEKVKNMDLGGLAKFIKTKNVIFYTGAGISAAAGIFTMNQLVKALGIRDEDFFDGDLICKLGTAVKVFEKFCDSMENSDPTGAHKSLLELANYKKCKIVTENLDSLHQKTGIEPYIIIGDRFRSEVKNEWAREIDAIVCCGLSHDDRGFLGWYKKNNPDGVIIAIDLGLPNYLGDKDFVLTGDVQEVIPKICFAVKEPLN